MPVKPFERLKENLTLNEELQNFCLISFPSTRKTDETRERERERERRDLEKQERKDKFEEKIISR